MITDKQCATVVMLCKLLENDEVNTVNKNDVTWCIILQEVCACYWPHTGVHSFDDVDVELTSENSAKHFTTRSMNVTDNQVRS